jgi:hypothetical protein
MDSRTFSVQGSAPEPYVVSFTRDGTNLTATCTCQAGANGQQCKHRLSILQGTPITIVGGDESDVALVRSWLHGTDVELALRELASAESQLEIAKHAVSVAKRRLARSLSD